MTETKRRRRRKPPEDNEVGADKETTPTSEPSSSPETETPGEPKFDPEAFEEETGLLFEADMNIDPDALDVEWLEQSRLVMMYGREAARASRNAALAEEEVKTVRSELIKKATAYPDVHLGEGVKPSDSKVEAFYRTHPDYKAAKKEQVEAEYISNLCDIAKMAAFKRGDALQQLVRLWLAEYFTGPENMPRDLREQIEERRETNREKRRQRLNK